MKTQNSKKKLSKTNPYLRYTNIGFQMLATILIGVGIGVFLDNKFGTKKIFTAIFSFLFVVASMYLVLKDFIKKSE